MSRGRRWALVLVVGVVAVLAVAGGAHLLFAASPSRHVAMPPDDATPEQVVRAFTEALDGHDCETAEALMTEAAWSSASSWCDDVASLTDLEIGTVPATRQGSAVGAATGRKLVVVPVTFHLDWRPFHGDGSLGEGRTSWGYRVERSGPSAPWRIVDQGTG